MKQQIFAVMALISVLALVVVLIVYSHSAKSPRMLSASGAAAQKLYARAETIKTLEAKAAKSDANAELALAKLLLDGTDTPPDYKRARGLLFSASKQLPEAIVGLSILQGYRFLSDKTLPDADALKSQALASQDVFAAEFLEDWTGAELDRDPPASILKMASSGNPWSEGKLAYYYGNMSFRAEICRRQQESMKKLNSLGEHLNLHLRKCSTVPKIANSDQLALKYASYILDAKEVEADKVRYWSSLQRRLNKLRPSLAMSSNNRLTQMYYDYVVKNGDPYADVIAGGLSQVGTMLILRGEEYDKLALAVNYLTRAAELGDRDAQGALGELYKNGNGTLKDYELAARYFAQSAQQANYDAMKYLGIAYIRGQGVEQNKVQAYVWLSLCTLGETCRGAVGFNQLMALQKTSAGSAYDDTSLDPATVRDEIAQYMTAQEIAEAQRLARAWRPSYQSGPPPSIGSINAGVLPKAVEATSQKLIAMQKNGGGYVVPVLIDGTITLNFVVDSGASDVTIPSDVVTTLMRTGTVTQSDFLGTQTYVLADGSKVPSRTFRIRSLKIGDTVVENLTASVAPAQGPLLLGQSFLGHFKSWSIDNTKHALVLE